MIKVPSELPQMSNGTGEVIGQAMKEWASLYQQCRIRQHGLVDAINEAKQ